VARRQKCPKWNIAALGASIAAKVRQLGHTGIEIYG